jgi:hypothetical protein
MNADAGEKLITFGMHKGKTFYRVYTDDKRYVEWAKGTENPSGALKEFQTFVFEKERAQSAAASTAARVVTSSPAQVVRSHCALPSSPAAPLPPTTVSIADRKNHIKMLEKQLKAEQKEFEKAKKMKEKELQKVSYQITFLYIVHYI